MADDDNNGVDNTFKSNSDFRLLLSQQNVHPSRTEAIASNSTESDTTRGGGGGGTSTKSKLTDAETAAAKDKHKRKLAAKAASLARKEMEADLASRYRDRASERRTGTNVDYKNVDETMRSYTDANESTLASAEDRLRSYQESKYLGGDMAHTHLVKGLDFALLEKTRMSLDKVAEQEQPSEPPVLKKEESSVIVKNECTKNPTVKRIHDILFNKPELPRRNELFAKGRIAFLFDLEDNFSESDIPTTIIRSLGEASGGSGDDTRALSTHDIVINKLSDIIRRLGSKGDSSRIGGKVAAPGKKFRKKVKNIECDPDANDECEEEIPCNVSHKIADANMGIFDDIPQSSANIDTLALPTTKSLHSLNDSTVQVPSLFQDLPEPKSIPTTLPPGPEPPSANMFFEPGHDDEYMVEAYPDTDGQYGDDSHMVEPYPDTDAQYGEVVCPKADSQREFGSALEEMVSEVSQQSKGLKASSTALKNSALSYSDDSMSDNYDDSNSILAPSSHHHVPLRLQPMEAVTDMIGYEGGADYDFDYSGVAKKTENDPDSISNKSRSVKGQKGGRGAPNEKLRLARQMDQINQLYKKRKAEEKGPDEIVKKTPRRK